MADRDQLVRDLKSTQKFFNTTIRCFEEADGGFAPKPEMMSVTAQVAHVAHTLDWFVEGAFGAGWSMDFEAAERECRAVKTLSEAKQWLDRAFAGLIRTVENASPQELAEPLKDERILGPSPRSAIVGAVVDHTAHHRGSLAVYARLLGKVPPMPYM